MKNATKIILLIALLLVGYIFLYQSSKDRITVLIKDKERITTGSKENISSKYLVYTEGEVFENTDALMFFKWDSSDLQNELDVGGEYKVLVVGWRIPFLSTYRNIIRVVE